MMSIVEGAWIVLMNGEIEQARCQAVDGRSSVEDGLSSRMTAQESTPVRTYRVRTSRPSSLTILD